MIKFITNYIRERRNTNINENQYKASYHMMKNQCIYFAKRYGRGEMLRVLLDLITIFGNGTTEAEILDEMHEAYKKERNDVNHRSS